MRVKPWSKFRRTFEIVSRGSPSNQVPRFLQCAVIVAYGIDPRDQITIPLYLGNHYQAAALYPNNNLRGFLWAVTAPTPTSLGGIDTLPIEPAAESPARQPWGKPPEQQTINPRPFSDSSYPYGAGYPP